MNLHNKPIITIIIATFNSESVLPRTLHALLNQKYSSEKMEILIIDGGSTDATIDIALKNNCKVINNPQTEPVHAKLLGIRNANGRYLMVLDHDEVLTNPNSICDRVRLLEEHPSCKVAFCSGYKRPNNYPLLNEYISEFGDPFSLFVYRFSKGSGFLESELRKICTIKKDEADYLLVSFENIRKIPIFELCCVATIIDLDFFKKHTGIADNSHDMINIFYIMLSLGYPEVILLKNDPLLHYSVDSIKAYLPKLKWRIRNNAHFSDKAENGYYGREKYTSRRMKKYLFPLYSITVLFPVIDAIRLTIQRKNCAFLLHPFLCLYVSFNILYEYILKTVGITPEFKSYDGKKVIKALDTVEDKATMFRAEQSRAEQSRAEQSRAEQNLNFYLNSANTLYYFREIYNAA